MYKQNIDGIQVYKVWNILKTYSIIQINIAFKLNVTLHLLSYMLQSFRFNKTLRNT